MRTVLACLRATHPLPGAAVTALVGLVTAARGADGATVGWVLASTAAGQASVGWSNDYLDRHADAAAARADKPLVSGEVSPGTVLVLAAGALPASALLSLPVGLPEALIMLAAVLSAWAYNAGFKATPLSWLPYAVSFGLVPVYIWLATGDRPPVWIVAGGALLGVGAHLLNVIPDLEADRTARGSGTAPPPGAPGVADPGVGHLHRGAGPDPRCRGNGTVVDPHGGAGPGAPRGKCREIHEPSASRFWSCRPSSGTP